MATAPALEQHFDPPEDADPPRDYEAEARAHGWTPKNEFKGDENRWIDAETFVRKADEVMPLLRKKTQAQDRRIADLEKTIKTLAEHNSRAETRMYNRAIADLKAKQEEAVENGDLEAHRNIEKELDELKSEVTNKPDPNVPTKDDVNNALEAWVTENKWYSENPDMAIWADKWSEMNGALAKTMPPAEFFAKVAEATLERFKTEKPERRRPINPVEAPTSPGARRGERVFENLPRDSQAACDRMHRMGILKGPQGKELTQAEARAQYCRDYDWDSK